MLFESGHLRHDLARKSVRGGITTMSAQGVSFVLNMIRTMVLARLLTPADFGLVGMVTVVVGFAAMFKDAGLSMATVQKDEINERQISTLFWCNLVLSACIGFCVLLASPLVSVLYKQPAFSTLTWVTATLSISFIFGGLTIQHQALMRRHMMFTQLAYIAIVVQIISLLTTAFLAILGWRYWALVGGMIAQTLSNLSLVFFYCPWRPKRPAKGTGVRQMLMFGGHLTGGTFLNYIAANFDKMMIGRYFGDATLGFYQRAWSLLMLPLSQINGPASAVSIPSLSRLHATTDSGASYRTFFCKQLATIGLISVPIISLFIILHKKIIYYLLGPTWMETAPFFMAFSLMSITMPMANATGWLLVSQNRTKDYLAWLTFDTIIRVIIITIGIRYNILVLIYLLVAVSFLKSPLLNWWVGRRGPVSTWTLWIILGKMILACGITISIGFFIKQSVPCGDIIIMLLIGIECFLVSTAVLLMFRMERDTVRSLLRIILPKLQRSKP